MMRNVKRNKKSKTNKLVEMSRFWILVGITLAVLGMILTFIKNDSSNKNNNRDGFETKESETHVLEIPNQNQTTEPVPGVDKRW